MKKIRIGIDTRDLRISKTGARTYLQELSGEFRKGYPGFEFYFIDTIAPVYTGNNPLLKIIEHLRFISWKQVTLPLICMYRRCDILFCVDYFLPLLSPGFETVAVFHDAFFWQYPEQYNRQWLFLLNTLGIAAAKRSAAIITVTEYSRQAINRYTGLPLEKIYAVPLAPKQDAQPTQAHETVGLPRKYILHVGVLEKRKNLCNLVKAYSLLLQEGFADYYLVLAGGKVNKKTIDDSEQIKAMIEQLGLQERVLLPGFVSDEQLPAYYRNASMYAFVSVNEGFGIPALEAFKYDLPLLISNNNSLPEVAGDAALACDPFDVHDIKEKMKEILGNERLRSSMIAKGRQRLSLFSWQRTADEILQVFRNI